MALTVLDPTAALIVIDLQKGLAGVPAVHPLAEVVQRAAALARAFRARGLPVVLVTVEDAPPGRTEQGRRFTHFPPDFAELMLELDRQPTDRLVTKRTPGAFTRTSLEADLHALGVTQVVVCGVSTSMGVEATARQAYELGFNVAVAVDAVTDLSAQAHENSVERVFPRLGERAAAQEIIDRLDAARP